MMVVEANPATDAMAAGQGPPDWDALPPERVRCPLCAYNLRGLAEPRCPECGYKATWRELLNEAETRHPFLFEHHTGRDIRCFLRTMAAGWMPRRFWRTLTARHEVYVERLRRYALLSILLPLLGAACGCMLRAGVVIYNEGTRARAFAQAQVAVGNPYYAQIGGKYFNDVSFGSAQWERVDPPIYSVTFLVSTIAYLEVHWTHFGVLVTLLAWPWVTFAVLMILRRSMRLADIRVVHVLRCVIYSFDCISLVIIASMMWMPKIHWLEWNEFLGAVTPGMLIMFPIGSYRLGSAYSRYLRFNHPYLTSMAAQTITFLLLAAWASRVHV
jgi:hypothetical protein